MRKNEKKVTNDNIKLVPTIPEYSSYLEYDFPALKIGIAEYEEGPTGCTVFYFPKGATAAVDVRGGECGTIQVQQYESGDKHVDAICFTGGSEYGFGAVAGVASELLAMRNYSVEPGKIVQVPGAVIYDFPLRDNVIYPDEALGRAAMRNLKTGVFPLGAKGAGCSAAVGIGLDFAQREQSGQGAAFRQLGSVKMAFFTVVNAVGAVFDRDGQVVHGHLNKKTGKRYPLIEQVEKKLGEGASVRGSKGNTTLSLLVINQSLSPLQLRQLGRQVHTSMARAIQPFHTVYDGDVFFTVTTGEVASSSLSEIEIGVISSELAWAAILSCFT